MKSCGQFPAPSHVFCLRNGLCGAKGEEGLGKEE